MCGVRPAVPGVRLIRIGYAHLDRLISYPDVRYLSGCSFPIRMFVSYPDVFEAVAGARSVGTLRRGAQ